MTKEKLFEVIEEKTKGILLPNNRFQELVIRIRDTLYVFPDDIEISGLTSLEEFVKSDYFANSRVDPDSPDIERALEKLLTELHSWVKRQVVNGRVYQTESVKLKKKREKSFKIRISLIVFFGVLAVAAIILTALRLKFGETFCQWVPEIIGSFDFAIGIVFFALEQISDINADKMHDEAQIAVENGISESFVKSNATVDTEKSVIIKEIKIFDNSVTPIANNGGKIFSIGNIDNGGNSGTITTNIG